MSGPENLGLRRGGAAIVGAVESDLGAVAEGLHPIDLMAQGVQRALADCGLSLRDVDGLLCATAQSRTSGLSLSEYLGISPVFIDSTILGGSSPSAWCSRKRTRMPILVAIGSMPSTRLISRKPSSQSINATL